MSHELIYTSVPRGLRGGASGFCTVAMTAKMPDAMLERLELLSGYRPVFPLGDSQSASNPVNWAHWRVTVGDRPRTVLSRVAFAGADYSQRSNKFAHHIVLEPNEQPPAGPAWVMRQPGVMESHWPAEPCVLPAGRAIPSGDRPPSICRTWQSATGDAGWAGVLAETFRNAPTKPAFIVFRPGTDLLPLIEEALALLPPSMRWQVTFSTYFTDLPMGATCAWRCVVAGTPAAKEAARAGSRPLVIDLTQPMGPAPDGPLTEAARTGRGAADDALSPTPARSRSGEIAVRTTSADDSFDPTGGPPPQPGRRRLDDVTPQYVEEPADEDGAILAPSAGIFAGSVAPRPVVVRRGIPGWLTVTLCVICLAVGGGIGYFASTMTRQQAGTPADKGDKKDLALNSPARPDQPPTTVAGHDGSETPETPIPAQTQKTDGNAGHSVAVSLPKEHVPDSTPQHPVHTDTPGPSEIIREKPASQPAHRTDDHTAHDTATAPPEHAPLELKTPPPPNHDKILKLAESPSNFLTLPPGPYAGIDIPKRKAPIKLGEIGKFDRIGLLFPNGDITDKISSTTSIVAESKGAEVFLTLSGQTDWIAKFQVVQGTVNILWNPSVKVPNIQELVMRLQECSLLCANDDQRWTKLVFFATDADRKIAEKAETVSFADKSKTVTLRWHLSDFVTPTLRSISGGWQCSPIEQNTIILTKKAGSKDLRYVTIWWKMVGKPTDGGAAKVEFGSDWDAQHREYIREYHDLLPAFANAKATITNKPETLTRAAVMSEGSSAKSEFEAAKADLKAETDKKENDRTKGKIGQLNTTINQLRGRVEAYDNFVACEEQLKAFEILGPVEIDFRLQNGVLISRVTFENAGNLKWTLPK